MAEIYKNMQDFNIEVINFKPAPNSTLLDYFNKKLTVLKNTTNVNEIKQARLILMAQKPDITLPLDYLYSQSIPGKVYIYYHVCEIIVTIKNVDCTISNYSEVYFEQCIDNVVNEALSRTFRY